ncbi:hypothetical protein D3C79_511530 [compost metagenome]
MDLILALFQLGILGIQVGFEGLVAGDGDLAVVVIDVADGDHIPALLIQLGIVGVEFAHALTDLDVTLIDSGATLLGLQAIGIHLDRQGVGILIRLRFLDLGDIVIAEAVQDPGGRWRVEWRSLHHDRTQGRNKADAQGDGIRRSQCPFCHVKGSRNPW